MSVAGVEGAELPHPVHRCFCGKGMLNTTRHLATTDFQNYFAVLS